MKLIHDNDLVNISAGMNSNTDYVTSRRRLTEEEEALVGRLLTMGVIGGSLAGATVSAEMLRQYALNKGKKSSRILETIISYTGPIGGMIVGGILGIFSSAVIMENMYDS